MVRDKIGSFKERDDMQRWLQNWINQYVDGNPGIFQRGVTKAKSRWPPPK
jgi:predicted component of type VI protein secretion system